MLKKSMAAVTLTSFVIVCLLLFTTTPSDAGPLGILSFFVLMYLAALGALTFLFHSVNRLASRVAVILTGKSKIQRLTFRRAYYYASAVALMPVMLLAMQSVSQVGIYQLLLVLFFVAVAWIYVTKRTA